MGKKKKGGKGGKGGKAAKGKMAEEKVRQAKRDQLSREIEMGEMNTRQLIRAWREKMRRITLPEIKEDIEVAWRTFDRTLDNKDYSISILLDAIHNAAEDKRRSDTTHMNQVDKLLETYYQQLNESLAFYETTIETELDSTREQMAEIQEVQNEEENFLQTVTFDTKRRHEASIEKINSKNLSKLDTRKEQNVNIRRMAKTLLKRRLRNYSSELTGILRDYEESTKDKRKEFNVINEKDGKDLLLMGQQSKRIEKLYTGIMEMRDIILDFRVKADKEIADYRYECNYFHKAYVMIQSRLIAEQMLDREQLKIATLEYEKTNDYLKMCLEKFEKIFTMIELCEKYETFEDKFLLCPLSTIVPENNFENVPGNVDGDKVQEITTPTQSMEKFIKLIVTVENDVTKLKYQVFKLNDESLHLKNGLKLYMEKVTEPVITKKKENIRIPIILNPKDLIKEKI